MIADWELSFGSILAFLIGSVLLNCADLAGIVMLSIYIHKERKQKNAQE